MLHASAQDSPRTEERAYSCGGRDPSAEKRTGKRGRGGILRFEKKTPEKLVKMYHPKPAKKARGGGTKSGDAPEKMGPGIVGESGPVRKGKAASAVHVEESGKFNCTKNLEGRKMDRSRVYRGG